MKKLVFCHGLPYNKSFFMPLILSLEAFYGVKSLTNSISLADFQQDKSTSSTEDNSFVFTEGAENQIEIINLDLGYFGDKSVVGEDLDGAICVGHGLGFNKLLDMDVKWSGIVGISTLLQFVSDTESSRKIENLENSLNDDLPLALKSLVARLSGGMVLNLPYPLADINLIKADVQYLKNTDSSAILKKKKLPTLFLHGGKDVWYNADNAKAQLADYNLIMNESASHILGYAQALWCREQIAKFIDSL
ncbi:MAG: hypothetical protein LBQ34_05575 [Alphaproteobacteria bacterium]|jgi:hypothetical protein|nr:hypothetical protein [Alphaproteobacteria bacterium]